MAVGLEAVAAAAAAVAALVAMGAAAVGDKMVVGLEAGAAVAGTVAAGGFVAVAVASTGIEHHTMCIAQMGRSHRSPESSSSRASDANCARVSIGCDEVVGVDKRRR